MTVEIKLTRHVCTGSYSYDELTLNEACAKDDFFNTLSGLVKHLDDFMPPPPGQLKSEAPQTVVMANEPNAPPKAEDPLPVEGMINDELYAHIVRIQREGLDIPSQLTLMQKLCGTSVYKEIPADKRQEYVDLADAQVAESKGEKS